MKTLVFIALICGLDRETGAHTRDCGPYEQPAASVRHCHEIAAMLRTHAPVGVRVVNTACFRSAERAPAMVQR